MILITRNTITVFHREEREWRKWVDEKLVHVISPNVYRTFAESVKTFEWFSTNGNWEDVFAKYERLFIVYVGATIMYVVGKKLRKKLAYFFIINYF